MSVAWWLFDNRLLPFTFFQRQRRLLINFFFPLYVKQLNQKNQNDTLNTFPVFYSLGFFFNWDFCWDVIWRLLSGLSSSLVCSRKTLPDDTGTVPSSTAYCSAPRTQQGFSRSRKSLVSWLGCTEK